MTGKVKAGDFVKFAPEQVGGKSGGRLGLEQQAVACIPTHRVRGYATHPTCGRRKP